MSNIFLTSKCSCYLLLISIACGEGFKIQNYTLAPVCKIGLSTRVKRVHSNILDLACVCGLELLLDVATTLMDQKRKSISKSFQQFASQTPINFDRNSRAASVAISTTNKTANVQSETDHVSQSPETSDNSTYEDGVGKAVFFEKLGLLHNIKSNHPNDDAANSSFTIVKFHCGPLGKCLFRKRFRTTTVSPTKTSPTATTTTSSTASTTSSPATTVSTTTRSTQPTTAATTTSVAPPTGYTSATPSAATTITTPTTAATPKSTTPTTTITTPTLTPPSTITTPTIATTTTATTTSATITTPSTTTTVSGTQPTIRTTTRPPRP